MTVNDTVKRDALSPADKRRFLEFVRTDPHFSRYYEGIYILFHTGMRISEFCGLTIEDLDMDKGTILVSKQLQRVGTRVYIEDQAKTKCGTRIIPMEPMVKEAFRTILDRRITPAVEPEVDGVRGFLCLDKDGHPMLALHWEHYFQHTREKFNKIYRDPMPYVSPHVCRHTYCTEKAKAGMNPVHLAYLMGHSSEDIRVTMGTYTHIHYEDAAEELRRLGNQRSCRNGRRSSGISMSPTALRMMSPRKSPCSALLIRTKSRIRVPCIPSHRTAGKYRKHCRSRTTIKTAPDLTQASL